MGATVALPAHGQSFSAPAQQTKRTDKSLTVTPSVAVTYDDNVYRDGDDEPKAKSAIIAPGVDVTYKKEIGVHDITLAGTARYDFYTAQSQRNNGRFSIEGLGNARLGGRCVISPDLSYRQEQTDYGDISAAVNNLRRSSILGATFACPRSAGIYPSVTYEHRTTRNSDTFDYADETGDRILGGVAFSKPSFGQLLAFYAYEDVDRPVLGLSNRSDQAGLRFTRSISSLLSAKVEGAYLHVRSSGAGIRSYKGPSWDVELSSRVIPFTLLTIDVSRKIVNDSLVASGFAIQTGYSGQAQIGLNELTVVRLFGDYKTRRFRQDPNVTRTALESDNFFYGGGEVSRLIGDGLKVKASAIHFRRRTADNSNDYSANQFSLGLEKRF